MSLRKKLKMDNLEDESEDFDINAESEYFQRKETNIPPEIVDSDISDISNRFLQIELELMSKLNTLTFTNPVNYVYSPLEYAFVTHSMFVKKYCASTKKILFLGLNPGPWGMSQTGVPFGEVNIVRDWLKIEGPVQKPERELPVRAITGFSCTRSEISGKRFWGLFQTLCGTPEKFFKYAYMHNYCPIALMKDSGVNVTPAELKSNVAAKLFQFCDEALSNVIQLLKIETIVAIGRFAEKRAKETIKVHKIPNVEVLFLLHPSPRVPGNENWQEKAEKALTDLKLIQYFKN